MLARDMWVGDGKNNPSVTTRLLSIEQAMERFTDNSTWAFRLGVATILAVLGDIAAHAIWK
jgi:hypothetical protein